MNDYPNWGGCQIESKGREAKVGTNWSEVEAIKKGKLSKLTVISCWMTGQPQQLQVQNGEQ